MAKMRIQNSSRIRYLVALIALLATALAGGARDVASGDLAGVTPEETASQVQGDDEVSDEESEDDAGALDELIEMARQEGELWLNWNDYADIMPQWIDGYLSMYGLEGDVEVIHTPGASGLAMFTQLEEEFAAGRPAQTDIMDGPELRSAISMIGLENDEGFAATLPYTDLPNITEDMVTGESRAVTYAHTFPGIAYNTDAVAEEDVPVHVDDVVDEDFLERYTIATTASVAGFDWLFQEDVWGFERTCDFVTRLGNAADGYIETHEAERIASGEFDVFVFDMGLDSRALAASGAPIGFVIPDGYVFRRTRDFVIPKHAAHPAAAQLFINYMLSPEAQDILYDSVGFDSHYREGSKSGPEYDERVGGLETAPVEIDADFIFDHFFEEIYPYTDVLQEMAEGQHSPEDCAELQARLTTESTEP